MGLGPAVAQAQAAAAAHATASNPQPLPARTAAAPASAQRPAATPAARPLSPPAAPTSPAAGPTASTAAASAKGVAPSFDSFGTLPEDEDVELSDDTHENVEENDIATVSVPRDVVARVRSDAAAMPRMYDEYDEGDEAATTAVPREELLRPRERDDGHVVIGAGASAEDATVAAVAGDNPLGGAFGDQLRQSYPGLDEKPAPVPASAGYPSPQPVPLSAPHGFPQPMGAQQGPAMMQGQFGGQMQGHMSGHMPMPMQHPQHPQHPHQGAAGNSWSSGQMAAAPRMPGAPMPPGVGPYSHPGPGNPYGMPPQGWGPMPVSPMQAQAPQRRPKLSGQMILLLVVGVICLGIFVTGIVLFATTKF